jgi:hypothetical protein
MLCPFIHLIFNNILILYNMYVKVSWSFCAYKKQSRERYKTVDNWAETETLSSMISEKYFWIKVVDLGNSDFF